MPLLNIYTSAAPLPDTRAAELLQQLSASVAACLQKPESYVMTCLMPRTTMTFAGTAAPSCYVEVKGVGGVSASATNALSADVTQRLNQALGVPGERIYIVFSEVPGHLWAHNGNTFG